MSNVLLTGAWFWNKGAEAMIRSVQAGVLSELPDTTDLLDNPVAEPPASDSLRGLQLWSSPGHARTYQRVLTGLGHRAGLTRRLRMTSSTQAIAPRDLSAVIDISGYAFGDPWQHPVDWRQCGRLSGLKQSIARAVTVDDWTLYHALGIPIFHLPQAWGPFEGKLSQRMAERILRGASKVYARDDVSYEWLQTISTFSAEKVARASDIAFSFKGASPEVGRALLADIGVQISEKPIVGIVPNMRVYERAEGEGAHNTYVQSLVAIARWFSLERQCQIVLMPHEIKPMNSAFPDDRSLCRMVADAVGDKANVQAALADYTAEELKAMIGQTEMLVSSRFHSIIAAMSLRRPVVSLAWSHKYHELMKSVGLEEFVTPHDTDLQSLLGLCESAWANRATMADSLNRHVPAHEASAANVLREVTEMIRDVI